METEILNLEEKKVGDSFFVGNVRLRTQLRRKPLQMGTTLGRGGSSTGKALEFQDRVPWFEPG